MTKKSKGNKHLTNLEKVLALLFGVIIITMFTQVVFRYLLNQSLYWSEEIVRYLFVWLVFLGGAAVIRDGSHIGIDILIMKLPKKFSRTLRFLNAFLMLLVNLFFIVAGVLWVIKSDGSVSAALELPINLVLYASLPVASIIATYLNIKRVLKSEDQNIAVDQPQKTNII
jgi:TRAP-type C4-dicarboxylate transport system permease small subunit